MVEVPPPAALVVHPNVGRGRAEHVVLQTVTALVEEGWRVVTVLPAHGPLAERLTAIGSSVETVPAPVLRKRDLGARGATRFIRHSLTSSPRIAATLRRIAPDAVVVSTMTQPEWVLTARLLRIPVLVHVQELATDAPLLVREAIARPMSTANRVLVDSNATRDALLDVVPTLAARTAVLPTGVGAPTAVEPARADLVDGVRVCCVARVERGAGLRTVVDALRLLIDDGLAARLEIAALAVDADALARLRGRLRELRLQDLVHVRLVEDDLSAFLERADVVVVPSRAETSFGGTAVDAVLAGRPVIVSTSRGVADWTEGFTSAIPVDDGDPVELARALHRVVSNWTAFRRSAGALAPIAGQRFSPAAYRATLAAEVRALTAPARRTHPRAA